MKLHFRLSSYLVLISYKVEGLEPRILTEDATTPCQRPAEFKAV